jgi:hypothetical protein
MTQEEYDSEWSNALDPNRTWTVSSVVGNTGVVPNDVLQFTSQQDILRRQGDQGVWGTWAMACTVTPYGLAGSYGGTPFLVQRTGDTTLSCSFFDSSATSRLVRPAPLVGGTALRQALVVALGTGIGAALGAVAGVALGWAVPVAALVGLLAGLGGSAGAVSVSRIYAEESDSGTGASWVAEDGQGNREVRPRVGQVVTRAAA